MDITAVFKACLETVRQRNKELALLHGEDSHHHHHHNLIAGAKSKIFPGKKSEYYAKARELSATITSLRDFLHENRNAYLNIAATSTAAARSHAKPSVFASASKKSASAVATTTPETMTDFERDQIDSDVQKIVNNCQRRIKEFETIIETTDHIRNNSNLHTHLESIANSLGDYLKSVTVVYSEMKAIRVKRTIDYQSMSRLSSHPSSRKGANNIDKNNFGANKTNLPKKKTERSLSVPDSENDGPAPGTSPSSVPAYFLDDEIPPEELQILEEENAVLLNELNSLANEVDQIQSSVVQIAQLQEIFTEKVLQQDKEVENLANVVVKTTENIKGGNEQIRQAIQKNADFRVWVLFFILVMSFSLLFLDWYND